MKDSALTTLASANAAGADLFAVVDTSATVRKKVGASDLIDFGARASQEGAAGIVRYDGTTLIVGSGVTTLSIPTKVAVTTAAAQGLAVGRQGATNPALEVKCDVATNVTGIQVVGRAAAAGADLNVISSGSNEPLVINAKGTGTITLAPTSTGNVITARNLQFPSAGNLVDPNGNELVKFPATVASAVNEVTITNAITTNPPIIAATGDATNISLRLTAKGTGCIQTTQPLVEEMTISATADTVTLTIAQLLTKVIRGVPTAAANYTLPTAANVVGGIANAQVGDGFDFVISNKSAGANTITVLAGGATLEGTVTIAQNAVRFFRLVITNVGGGTEAYSVYGQS